MITFFDIFPKKSRFPKIPHYLSPTENTSTHTKALKLQQVARHPAKCQRFATKMGFYFQNTDPPGDPMYMSSPLFKNLQTTMDALGYDDTLSWSTQTTSAPDTNLAHYPRLMYYYHPDYLGHVEYITDLDGVPYQYFYYTSPMSRLSTSKPLAQRCFSADWSRPLARWGETLIEEKATRPGMHFESPYRFNAKELDEEPTNGSSRTPLKINYACEQTGLYYYGARYYNPTVSVWLGVDPLAHKGPNLTPYAFTHNNPVTLVDPDGMWPNVGFGIGFRTNFTGGYSVSVAMGISQRGRDAMGSINMSFSAYNYGLGTTHGSGGSYSRQMDLVISPALTMGTGEGRALPLNTFSNNMPSGVFNNFEGSGTLASNFVLNSNGRNQRVGFAGGKIGSASFGMYNDVIPGLGDKDDRWYTGGGNLTIASDFGNFFIGTDVFTGERLGRDDNLNWLSMPSNPSGGLHGTYAQSFLNQLLNNGQSLSTLPGINASNFQRWVGRDQMWSQDYIHNFLTNNLLFYSTANGE
jgi:RHS repeat-associated protein